MKVIIVKEVMTCDVSPEAMFVHAVRQIHPSQFKTNQATNIKIELLKRKMCGLVSLGSFAKAGAKVA